ncbi:MAG: MBL fold metallo-hydrolase, partial [Oscillospiraceae bacterium]|nr:MBL fold metallo-hydrolase [Oscillospiraceae bacterium]
DSSDCFGYRFYFSSGKSIAIATDLGRIDDNLIKTLSGCHFVGIEANYDHNMLMDGSYPQYLKQRIASRVGHLSNKDCAQMIVSLAESGTTEFMLMHLSKENNDESLAQTEILSKLEDHSFTDCMVHVAPRNEPSIVVEI